MKQAFLLQRASRLADTIPGWLSDVENEFLFTEAARARTGGAIVEIGSYKGRSTVFLALGAQSGTGNRVFAIDPHTGSPDLLRAGEKIWTYDEFTRNIKRAGAANIVTPIVATGEETAKNWGEPIALLFVDANYHSYELTENLLRLWTPHLMEGGKVLLNNVAPSLYGILRNKPLHGLPGPRRAFEALLRSGRFAHAGIRGCVGYAAARRKASFVNRLAGYGAMVSIQISYCIHAFYTLFAILPPSLKGLGKRMLARCKIL